MAATAQHRCSGCGLFMRQLHVQAGVHDPAALLGWQDEDRIEVEFAELRYALDQSRDAQQHLLEGGHVRARMASIACKKACAPNAAHHVKGVAVGEGGDPEAHVAQYLDMEAAQTKGDQGTE